jgi:hypothetical protein
MKMIRARLRTVLPAALAVVVSAAAAGTARAELTLPRVSQNATVTQTVGLTDFRVVYHRPGVKGRKIWGGLVPYGEKWRLGANDATSFAVTGDATVGAGRLSWRHTAMHWRMCCSQTHFSAPKVSAADSAWPAIGTYFAACCVVRRTPTVFSTLITKSRVISLPTSMLPPADSAL